MKKYSIIILLLIICAKLRAQEFTVSPLITIPGDNINFSIVSPFVFGGNGGKSFICWENKLDSIYTIYLKRIDTLSNHIYTVYSDTNQNISPSIAYIDSGIRIVWQSLKNNQWGIYSREYRDGIFSEVKLLTDTTTNNVTPSLDYKSEAWIKKGKLICDLYSLIPEIVDSNNCSNPKMIQSNYEPIILYEKGIPPNTQIYLARHIGQIREQKPYWLITQISDSGYNINPSFGINDNISYQTFRNNKWQIIYTFDYLWYGYKTILKTNNLSCNYEHPTVFTYPIPSKNIKGRSNSSTYPGGYFVAFDSDSLKDNKEIFINYTLDIYGYNTKDSLINISNSSGNDIKPVVTILKPSDTTKIGTIAIIWEHAENNKSDIWWAVIPFRFLTDVKNDNNYSIDFFLSQNFPNPFNSTTKIKYTIPTPSASSTLIKGRNEVEFVSLKVYDILGNEVATLVNKEQNPGNYEIEFDGSKYNLSSGIYFYVLKVGDNILTRKMCLIK